MPEPCVNARLTFYGAVAGSTIATALLSVLHSSLSGDSQQLEGIEHGCLVQELVRAVATHLLQLMKPHAFLQQAHAGVHLPADYESFYCHQQPHYNLKQLLAAILGSSPLPSLASALRGDLASAALEPATDQPESSAAAEARASAGTDLPMPDAHRQRLLQPVLPSSKWVIFTSTLPDLDMGTIMPAGRLHSAYVVTTAHFLLALGCRYMSSLESAHGVQTQTCCDSFGMIA